jgi:hypothetical protein
MKIITQSSLLVLLVLFAVVSCSKSSDDVTTYDSSNITKYGWHLNAEKLSQAVDLNKDGVFSLDATEEFDCKKNEKIRFNFADNTHFELVNSNFVGLTTYSANNAIESFECNINLNTGRYTGTFIMSGPNTIELKYLTTDLVGNFNPGYVIKYNLLDNKLITTSTVNYPISYNVKSQSWNYSQLQVSREYIPITN